LSLRDRDSVTSKECQVIRELLVDGYDTTRNLGSKYDDNANPSVPFDARYAFVRSFKTVSMCVLRSSDLVVCCSIKSPTGLYTWPSSFLSENRRRPLSLSRFIVPSIRAAAFPRSRSSNFGSLRISSSTMPLMSFVRVLLTSLLS
jgi:hypothetical protein